MPDEGRLKERSRCSAHCATDPWHFPALPYLTFERSAALYHTLKYVLEANVSGHIAECGAYKGDTARGIATYLRDKAPWKLLHVFEGFLGIPQLREEDDRVGLLGKMLGWDNWKVVCIEPAGLDVTIGAYRATQEEFWQTIGNVSGYIQLHAGWFHDTMPLFKEPLCAVHIDCDVYSSTVLALGYCAPIVLPGGVMVIDDDQSEWAGVTRAVDVFLAEYASEWDVDRDDRRRSCILWKRGE